tara:strand:- start:9234 stop:10772 length:1539 start_codon:yes stop_codon:yes gene_type:complete
MAKRINRNIYRGILIISFIAVNALILFGISSVLAYLNTGADRTSMLHLEVERDEVYLPLVTWDGVSNPGRSLEEQTQGEIERDYLSAWYVRNIAYKNNDYYGIEDYYTDSARVKLYQIIDYNLENDISITSTTLDHHLTLDFYSADGKLVVLEDKNVTSFRQVTKKGEAQYQERDTTSYKVMLLLEDGFWRIRHLVKTQNETVESLLKATIDSLTITNAKGINYYPKNSPWDTFGKKYKDSTIDADFKVIRKMGLNTIRIFIPYEDFGKTSIDPDKLHKVQRTLEIAEKNELKAIITLFDFYGNYDITDWTITAKHATLMVNALKDYKALLAWDIKNEPDLDFNSRGERVVTNWLEQMISTIKSIDSKHAVTIGWSSPEAAVTLATKVDFVSFHYYKKIVDFTQDFEELKKNVPSKTIMLQEYGLSSYGGIWNFYTGSEAKQADYYKEIQPILLASHIPFVAWTLYDFEEVPTAVAGRLPWKKNKQHYFGFINEKGKFKPAYKHIIVKNKGE